MIEREVEIVNQLGLHARAAAKLVNVAARFGSTIEVTYGGQTADAKSIMSVMMLAASKGSIVSIKCSGQDEEAASLALCELIHNYFEEEE